MSLTRVTVAICTWNRSALLEETLRQMEQLVVPPGVTWELLVVNNNSTDDTDAVIARYATRLPIRRLFEATPGLSNARNCAVREATGAYILWTDDDVLVSSAWLGEYCRAFQERADAVIFGGPVEPWFPNTPPAWLEAVWPRVFAAYACIDHGDVEMPLDYKRLPFGANMAIRTDVQRRFPYDPERGVRPGSRVGGEEIDVVRRSLAEGGGAWWVPRARVRHYIPETRQSRAYLRGYFHADGEYIGRYESQDLERFPRLFGRPRWLWRAALVAELRYRLLKWFRPPSVWIDDLIMASTSWGKLHGFAMRAPRGLAKA